MIKLKNKPTMQDIANELGVSRFTVSSVVNGKSKERNISQKTIDRIESYLKNRGFVTSSHALALKNKNTCSTGILCSGKLYSHLLEAFNQLTNHFINLEQTVEIAFTQRYQLNLTLRNLISRGISHLIWIHSSTPENEIINKEETFALLKHVNTTIYNYHPDSQWDQLLINKNIKLVGIDRLKIFKDLTLFIKKLNHQNVFILKSDSAYAQIFLDAGLNLFAFQGHEENNLSQTAKGISQELIPLIKNKKVTIACFRDDELAGFVMHYLIQADIKIPQDISITGFDGMSFSECFDPPLTTLKVPVNEMVMDVLSDLPLSNKKNLLGLFECQLISRKSHRNL